MTWNPSLIDGPLTIPTYGPADPETGERPVTGIVPGYHLNVARSLMTPDLDVYEVTPEPITPLVTFAGDAPDEAGRYALTAFLVFADEAQAVEALPGLWSEPVAEPEPEPEPEPPE
jgi:hypothetical protein